MRVWRVLLAGALGSLVLLACWFRPAPVPVAEAQGVGIFSRLTCSSATITNAVTGQTVCFDQTANKWKVLTPTGNWLQPPTDVVNVRDFGAVDDGVTDNCAPSGTNFFQQAVNAATSTSINGGAVYIPTAATRWLCSSGIKVFISGSGAAPLSIVGDGKWATVIRYTGTGSFITPAGTTSPMQVRLEAFTVQLTDSGAKAIDASQFISSTFRSLRFAWSGAGAQGGIGMSANPTNAASSPFYNVLDDLTFDSVASGIVLNTQNVTSPPNRWRILAPTFLAPQSANTIAGIVIANGSTNLVAGTDIIAPYCDQIGGPCIFLGANADRTTIVAARLETAQGGKLFDLNPGSNRTNILGYAIHAGTAGVTTTGTRTMVLGSWDDWHFSNSVSGSANLIDINNSSANGGMIVGGATGGDQGLGTINYASATFANGLAASVASPTGQNVLSVRGISSGQGISNNLRGTCTFGASATCSVAFARNEPDTSYFVTTGCNVNVGSKAVSGFTMTATGTNSNACDWMLFR